MVTLFLLLATHRADVLTTYVIFALYPDAAVELNPIMALVLSGANPWFTMATLKIIAVVACSIVIEFARRTDKRVGRIALGITLSISLLPVVFNLWGLVSMG